MTPTDNQVIHTPRLDLVPATLAALQAELAGRVALSEHLGADVPPSWPPPLYDVDAIRWMLARLSESPAHERWGARYFLRRVPHPVAVGIGGYKSPPTNGEIEIGYSLLPEFQGQGLAAEACSGLVARAFEEPDVRQVVAETLPDLRPSISVLERAGFHRVGGGSEEWVMRFAITREDVGEGGRGRRSSQ